MNQIIYIAKHLPSTITTRKAIEVIRENIPLSDKADLIFDFKGIDFISRAFADEFVHFIGGNNIQARCVNTNPTVREMLNAVEKNREKRKKNYHNIAIIRFSEKAQLNQLLSLI
jgi:anti-anti-sigma regulatory factor